MSGVSFADDNASLSSCAGMTTNITFNLQEGDDNNAEIKVNRENVPLSVIGRNGRRIPGIPTSCTTIGELRNYVAPESVIAECIDNITVARVGMLNRVPFWGMLATRLNLEIVASNADRKDPVLTASTDGVDLWAWPTFINDLEFAERVFLLGHEVAHVVLEHPWRGVGHHDAISNIAADFAANEICVTDKIGRPIGGTFISAKDVLAEYERMSSEKGAADSTKMFGTLYDPMFAEWTYQEIYDYFMKNIPPSQRGANVKIGFDSHGEVEVELGEGESPGQVTPEQMEKIRRDVRRAVVEAAMATGIGNLSAGILRNMHEFKESVMPWQSLLLTQISSQLSNLTTFTRPNRRSWGDPNGGGIIFPGHMRQPRVEAWIGLDMSGSIDDETVRDMLSEVVGIMSSFSSYSITVFCWDTEIYNIKEFTELNSDEMTAYQPQGGGGTSLNGVFQYFHDNDIVPKQLVILTDGEICGWGDPDLCNTLFVIKNTRKGIVAPYGQTRYYNPE